MGIRFLCPNGHKLNVKAFLAGKRGICPNCDAKFLVPATSGGQAEAISETSTDAMELEESMSVGPLPAHPPPAPAPAPPTHTTLPPDPAEVWYLRTATGEQFGPASQEVMLGWVAEGRVGVDCWVWRTGWPDWKSGGQALSLLNVPPPILAPEGLPPAAPSTATADTSTPAQPATETLPTSTTPTAQYRLTKRHRQDRARKVTFFLGAVVFLLFVVLIVVLMKSSG